MKKWSVLGIAASVCVPGLAFADSTGKVYELGQVTATAPTSVEPDADSVGGYVVTQEDIRDFNRITLDQAIQLAPGASVSEVGARNETDIWLRGFDRFRVPLYQDGIPVFLPADNRIDFSRFTTGDISEIQISKGFTSVIDGPGALGGSVNIVSREVQKPLEADVHFGSSFDSDGTYNGSVVDAFVGMRQGKWFIQESGSENYRKDFRLSDDFTPSPAPLNYENGGQRERSFSNDYKFNVKVGYAPSSTDEYTFNFIDQIGKKNNPPPDTLESTSQTVRYWDWPAWDKKSFYLQSRTAIDDQGSFVKARFYYDRFYNVLDAYDSASYTTQIKPSSFDSYYNDHALGATLEADKKMFDGRDVLRGSLWYRWDVHNAQEDANATTNRWYSQPNLHDEEMTYSAAVENILHPAAHWDFTTGVSYDYRHLIQAQDFDSYSPVPAAPPYGFVFDYPTQNKHALNPEASLVYHYSDSGSAHFSATERTRFPNLFEQFSSKMGIATGNPNLGPEKAINWEVGVADQFGRTHVEANLFLSRVRDAIESVAVTVAGVGNTTQSQNIGTETHEGFELALRSRVLRTLDLGGNYTYLEYSVDTPGYVGTDVPKQKLFAYADWRPVPKLSIWPNVDVESRRNLLVYGGTTYYRGGEFALVNLRASYQLLSSTSVDAGVNNLTDANYEIEDAYHAQGRNYYFNLRYQFD